MKETFKKGDKVICIDAGVMKDIINGEEYEIQEMNKDLDLVCLKGLPSEYFTWRFKLSKQTTKEIMDKKTVYNSLAKSAFDLMDLKIGDTVRITSSATSYQFGWSNTWSKSMEDCVGKEFEVKYLPKNGQLSLGLYHYPFFVIELVKRAPVLPDPIKISDDYNATFSKDGTVSVGCQKVSFETLTKIYETAKSLR